MLSPIAIKRLTILANYLARKRGHFDMNRWLGHRGGRAMGGIHGIKNDAPLGQTDVIKCGMTACAFGHAATIPYFKRLGLKLMGTRGYFRPIYDELVEFEAAAAFFDITEQQASELFMPSTENSLETPAEWARRCRRFILTS